MSKSLIDILFVLGVLCVFSYALISRLWPHNKKAPAVSGLRPQRLPYQKKWYLLSKGEKEFYDVLRQAVSAQYVVFAKVRLLDLLWLPARTPNRLAFIRRVSQKHIDFVLCCADTVSPALAIELDDRSHQGPRRQDRDEFVNEALKTAELPILRVPARREYDREEMARLIERAVSRLDV